MGVLTDFDATPNSSGRRDALLGEDGQEEEDFSDKLFFLVWTDGQPDTSTSLPQSSTSPPAGYPTSLPQSSTYSPGYRERVSEDHVGKEFKDRQRNQGSRSLSSQLWQYRHH